ncbi:MarR family winged helix-turn-helix transcriptional regulator [Caenibius tardaugens]|nr:MarR family transcriptional regulator [Caenibius tardaugens]AZI34764.1 MarR family transcriptional regulator [Caenibius tardaugens NBRC 16725]
MRSVGYLLSDCARHIRRRFDERMREVGVTGAQARLLMILAADEGRQQTHYASVLEVEPITLCRMVDRMVEADLIERSPDPNDRRARLLSRSDKARALEPVLQEKIDQLVDDIQSPFTSDELQILHRLLSRMGEQLVSPSEKITENKEVTAHG